MRSARGEKKDMPRLEANLQWMFNEYALLDRYDAAAKAGFKGVELQAPYAVPVDAIVERLEKNRLKHIIINLPSADPDTGKNNISLNPARKDLFKERLQMAVEYEKTVEASNRRHFTSHRSW